MLKCLYFDGGYLIAIVTSKDACVCRIQRPCWLSKDNHNCWQENCQCQVKWGLVYWKWSTANQGKFQLTCERILNTINYISCYLCCSMYYLCVNVYCHQVTTQLQLTNISYQFISIKWDDATKRKLIHIHIQNAKFYVAVSVYYLFNYLISYLLYIVWHVSFCSFLILVFWDVGKMLNEQFTPPWFF